jgi:hypothetical protein
MSLQQHTEALLEGYVGPYFPLVVDELHKTLNATKIEDEERLKAVAERVDSYTEATRPTTSDGYAQSLALHFQRGTRKEIVILLPLAQDGKKENNYPSDRSIAIYVLGRRSQRVVDAVVEDFIHELTKEGR